MIWRLNMTYLIRSYRGFDSFLKWQLWVGFLASLVWALSVPIVHKLQGVHWTTAYISLYLIFIRVSGLILPFFKGARIRNLYLITICLNVIYAASLLLYFYDVHLFLWAEVVLGIAYSVVGPLMGIGWDVWVVKQYPTDTFEDFRYWESFRCSLGGVIGSGLVALMTTITSLDQTVWVFMGAMVFMLMIQPATWIKHYRPLIEP